MTGREWARSLMDLWEIEGGECVHGYGYDVDCPATEDDGDGGQRPCSHNHVRPALRAAHALLEIASRRGPRYQLTYGGPRVRDGDPAPPRYVVRDRERRDADRNFESKVDAIATAQVLNGCDPADGSEETYGRQLAERGWR